MPKVNILDQEIYYAARGENGAPLVFVHGAGDSHLVWNGQLAAFAPVARALALDLPGHGRSTGRGRASIFEYATVVRGFLEALGVERAVIVGISMGGAIAQTLALKFPERVAGLGLVGTGAKLRVAPQFLEGMQTDFENTARVMAGYFYAAHPSSPTLLPHEAEGRTELLLEKSEQQLLATGRDVTYHDFAACDAFDARGRIPSIAAPTLVVCGREDRMTPLKYSEFLAQQIPHARLEVIENAGHLVMVEQVQEFNRALTEWLDTI